MTDVHVSISRLLLVEMPSCQVSEDVQKVCTGQNGQGRSWPQEMFRGQRLLSAPAGGTNTKTNHYACIADLEMIQHNNKLNAQLRLHCSMAWLAIVIQLCYRKMATMPVLPGVIIHHDPSYVSLVTVCNDLLLLCGYSIHLCASQLKHEVTATHMHSSTISV